MVGLDALMARCKHPNSPKQCHSKCLKIGSASQTIPLMITVIFAEWMVQSRPQFLEVFMIFGSKKIQSFQSLGLGNKKLPPAYDALLCFESVLRITVVYLDTFMAQWCKHPNLLKHHRSDCHKTFLVSRTIPIIAEWMLNLHHIWVNVYDFKKFPSNSELSQCSFLATLQVGNTALRWQNKTLQL